MIIKYEYIELNMKMLNQFKNGNGELNTNKLI